ncbi:hypothetical protein [Streptomyces sp. NBC_01367]|uniref:hypothetical protein n=1 Tax=Streptomyces sp. NBC_01367 TaxID=2903841 RepID=UPI003247BB15
MSTVITLLVAPDDTAAALVLQTGPGRAFESVSFGNVDPEGAVVEREGLLAGGGFEELVESGEPRIAAVRAGASTAGSRRSSRSWCLRAVPSGGAFGSTPAPGRAQRAAASEKMGP